MSVRKIKKYANRRLYDTHLSTYVTLSDLRDLILEGVTFKVIDVNNNRDITRSTLLSLLSEKALNEDETPILTQKMLSDIIRFSDEYLSGLLGCFLERSTQNFLKHQSVFRTQMQNFDAEDPHTMIERIVDMQNQLLEEAKENLPQSSLAIATK